MRTAYEMDSFLHEATFLIIAGNDLPKSNQNGFYIWWVVDERLILLLSIETLGIVD